MHNVDVSKYEIRTDLALDVVKDFNDGVKTNVKTVDSVKITTIVIENKNNILKKKPGTYITLEFDDITDTPYRNMVTKVLTTELKEFLNIKKISKASKALIVGLGNQKSTPDALGPLTSDKIIVTKHMFDMNMGVEDKFSNVSTIVPGVTGTTGIETGVIINGIVKESKPDYLIVVDALASSSISRVNRSVQISDSGISPGSGVGNHRMEISYDTINIPVIVIGVPTVVDAPVIVSDTINYMIKNYAYNKQLAKSASSKLITRPVNYLKYDADMTKEEKQGYLGLVGTLSDEELKEYILEVLSPIGYNLMVTPKEVDFVIEKLSDMISDAINNSVHDL